MKKVICLLLIGAIILNIYLIYNHFKDNNINNYKNEYVLTTNEKKIDILEEEQKNKIKVYFPSTGYEKLNKKVNSLVAGILTEFRNHLTDKEIIPNQYFTLFVSYDTYNYKSIISFVFYVEEFFGGAHPSHDLYTINYDTSTNRFITIDDLIQKNTKFLSDASKISYEKLISNPNLGVNNYTADMLSDGTKPAKDNFSNFVFSINGLVILFKRYQIAPYSAGDFVVTIPYEELGLNGF